MGRNFWYRAQLWWCGWTDQRWALPVFFHFFNNKNDLFALLSSWYPISAPVLFKKPTPSQINLIKNANLKTFLTENSAQLWFYVSMKQVWLTIQCCHFLTHPKRGWFIKQNRYQNTKYADLFFSPETAREIQIGKRRPTFFVWIKRRTINPSVAKRYFFPLAVFCPEIKYFN